MQITKAAMNDNTNKTFFPNKYYLDPAILILKPKTEKCDTHESTYFA